MTSAGTSQKQQQDEIKIVLTQRKKIIEKDLAAEKKLQEKRVKEYFEVKTKGTKSKEEVFWNIRDDFEIWAKYKGGYWEKGFEFINR